MTRASDHEPVPGDPRRGLFGDGRGTAVVCVPLRQHARLRAPARHGRDRAARVGHAGQHQDPPIHHLDARGDRHQGGRADRSRRERRSGRSRWSTSSRRCPARAPSGSSSAATSTPSCFASSASSAPATAPRAPRALLELARALKDRPRPFTIELLFLDGEEAVGNWSATDSTYGSRYYVQAAQQSGTLKSIKAFILLDMIGDKRPEHPPRGELDAVADRRDLVGGETPRPHALLPRRKRRPSRTTTCRSCRPACQSVDIIDLDYHAWHTADDTLENVSAQSLQIVGDVVLAALPDIEQGLLKN